MKKYSGTINRLLEQVEECFCVYIYIRENVERKSVPGSEHGLTLQ